jgi:hypothetical protein
MAGKIPNSKKIFVETDYDNVILVNPNEVYADDNKSAAPRLVDHEDLVYYANLETFIIPRTKLAIGESFDSPVFNTTIATVFGGDDDLKINFLKPKGGKTKFDTSWSDQITGKDSRSEKGLNQKTEQVVSVDGTPKFKNSVSNYEDTQLLGIKSIRVNIKGTGVPEVNIEMVDIQGRSLFEQGENSLYSAFFNFPYPLFYLTLKGYYGKAIRYRLSLMSFNAKFDAETGNYNISLKLIGKFTALLFDTPLQYAQTAPKMYNSNITVTDPTTGSVKQLNTYKGRQKLHEVYQIYKRKGLIDKDFDEISIDEFKYRVNNFVTNILDSLINDNKGDFTQLNDIIDYRENLTKLKKEVYENSLNNFLDRSSYYIVSTNGVNEIYYPFKKEISDQSRLDYKTKTQERITQYVKNLENNTTFGTIKEAKRQIPVNKLNSTDIIKKLDFNSWIANEKNVQNTFFYRTGKQYNPNDPNIVADYQKFVIDETKNADLTTKVLINNAFVTDTPDYFVFGDKLINDGVYAKNSYLFKLDQMEKTLNTNEEIIEKELGGLLSEAATGNLGFVPTIRNVFAVIMAGADAFYRLMDDVHQEAWNVRDDVARLMSVIPPEKAFSPDALKALQTSSGELNKDNVIYPWPLYFTLEKQKDGRDLYVIQYPGDSKVINQTRAYDYRIWPEIGFTEAYLKGSVEKAKPVEGNLYENPSDVTKYVSANALEFPFKTLPYQDLDAIKTFYEIYERSYIIAHYSKLDPTIVSPKQIDKFYGDIESKNISLVASDDISLNKSLKDLKLNLTTLLDYMKKISSNGQGDSWQTYLRSLFKTEYIENMLKVQDEIYSIDTLSSRSIKVSSDQPLVTNLTDYLKSTDSSKINTLDTYPFTNVTWLKDNMSNGFTLNSFDEFNDTTKTFVYLQDKKTIARINETETYNNIKLFTDDHSFKNDVQPYITDQTNSVSVTTRQTLFDFYKDRVVDDYYITESYLEYGDSYSGQVNYSYQTTSLLNTPYFINSIISGVELNKTKDKNAFVPLGYLYLNSMPLITTKEKLKNINNDGTITDLDYLAATFKKYSAIHQVPYAWVLKYGSIWHRYKKYVETGVDILDSVWKDFDYAGAYDPVTSAITTQYTIPNYTGGSQNIRLQNTEVFPIPSNQSKDIINVGFYPKVINAVNNFVIGKDLFTGYTTSDFLTAYTENKLRIGVNGQSTNFLNFGFDTANPNRSLIKQNYYQYREFSASTSTNQGNTSILLYPSMGGIPIDQSIFECVNDTNNLKIELLNNKSLYNGSVRSLWGTSHFGYFDNRLIKKPLPTQYLKNLVSNINTQYPFDIGPTQSFYSNIDEIFNIFTVEMLNKFEEKFLGFCNYNPDAKDLSLTDEIISPTYNQTGGLHNLEEKSLVSQIKALFVVSKTGIDFVNQNVDGKALATKQISSFTESVKKFLNFDCVIKLGNPGHFNRKLFNSFSNLTQFVPSDKYQFLPYVKGTLPGDGTSVTLLQSIAQNKDAWDSLRKYLGYSTIPNIEYQNQVQTAYPSVPLSPTPTTTTFTPPTPNQTFRTFQDLCTGQYFNIIDTNNNSTTPSFNYVNNHVWFLEVLDNTSQVKKFCAKKVPNSAVTATYNLEFDDSYPQTNAVNITPESYCLSFYQTQINCQQPNLTASLQLEFVGDSSVILPETPNQDNINYFNIVKPSGGYTVYKLTGIPVFEPLNFSSTLFYPANSDINDPNNSSLPFNGSSGLDTNYARVFEVNGNTSGNYIMTVKYAVTGVSYQTLVANISTVSGNQTTTPTPTNPNPNVAPLQNTQKSYVTDFFIDNNIAFNSANVETAYPLIRLYAEQKLKDPTFNSTKFTTFINNYLTSQYNLQNGIVNETFTNLNKILKDIKITTNNQPVTVNGDTTKLTLYNTLKGFNDKWIAGSDLKTVTLFEDFLYMDKANSDIGDTYIVDVQKVVNRLDTEKNPDMNLMQVVGNILDDNQFMFMAMPAYINFYGLQEAVKNGTAVVDPEVGNSLFGTYLEVDYTKSSPKFLCLYMGNPSEYPKPKENSFNRFGDDSFDLRVPADNPLRVSDTNRDYSKTNRVVGFSVDFGVQNQSIFKTLDLDMSEMKNTSESFKVFADIGSSVSGDKVGQQSTSMYGIYKSRSYSCGVQSMGNVMIQPTMYFVLRHVPMFYGPYWIYEVNHNVSERGFDTDFKGTRIPKYSLPSVNNLLINVNKKILNSFKENIKKTIPESGVTTQSDTEKLLTTDPKILTTTEVECRYTSAYPTIPFLDISANTYTNNQVATTIRSVTTNTAIRALLLGIATTSKLNTTNATTFNVINNNLYEITTKNAPKGNLATFITEQSCVDISGTKVPIAKFPDILTATQYMISYYQGYEPMIQNLVNLNPNVDVNVSYGKALTQLAVTTWLTAAAITSSLNAQQIKDETENKIFLNNATGYNAFVNVFKNSYLYFVQNP